MRIVALAEEIKVPSPLEAACVAPLAKSAARYGFIDLLRGFAILVMIETHVVNAYYPHDLRIGSVFFPCLSFINGLVAPAFLFASGFSLILQSRLQWDNWLHLRPPFWRQLRRLGFIFLIAYFLHLYGYKLSRYLNQWGDRAMWAKSLQVDVLQCIVASLLIIHALIIIVRKQERFPWAAGALAIGISLSTPWMWAHDFTKTLPISLAMYLNPHDYSLFPIFPWMCFVLIGSIASCLFLKAADADRINQFMKKSVVIGICLILAGYLLWWFPFTLPGKVHFYRTSPLFLMIRIGCVLLICALLYVLEIKKIQVPKLLQLAGRESLLIYGVHLVLIFNVLRGKRLGPILGLQLGYPGCFALSAAIIMMMLYLAMGWSRLKRWNLLFAKRFQAAAVVGMTIFFLLN